MGEVWLAEDTRLLRTVAIKILSPEVAWNAEGRARLMREARLAAQINHPFVATLHSIEESADCIFLVMEFVDGKPLGTALRERSLSDYDIVRTARDIAEALAEAHGRGIVHRDIKPDNIMISGLRVKVLDFGIAKQIGDESRVAGEFRTEAGMVVGTIEYMSPEQALGKPVDARTDVFSLGTVLYHALAGELPFTGTTPTETMLSICRDAPRPLSSLRPDLPEELSRVVGRCLEKDRELRFTTAAELAAALERVLPRLSRRALPVTPTMAISPSQTQSPSPSQQPMAPPPVHAHAQPAARKRILVADDDPAIRRLFEFACRRSEITCHTVENGPAAIAALKQHEYDMMFLDLMMPRIDGWGVLDFVRARPRSTLPAVFVITAFLDQNLSAADSEVVTGIIYKPVDGEEIGRLVREWHRGANITATLQRTRHRLAASA